MKDFVVFRKTNLFLILDLGELTEKYYENKFFRREVDDGTCTIYVRDPKKIQSMLYFQHNLDKLSDKLKKLIQ